jgi:DNA/RNA-binding domain of Phe-tRNA-synthetase-like protein
VEGHERIGVRGAARRNRASGERHGCKDAVTRNTTDRMDWFRAGLGRASHGGAFGRLQSRFVSLPSFTLAPELLPIVCPGVLWWTGATVVERDPRLDPLLEAAEQHVRLKPPAESAAVRAMYRRVGIDPTKTRPSNEALLRRVRKGQALPRVNSMVDVINWCSVEFQLPYGLYDAGHVSGQVTLRLGRNGEEYAGIRKDVVHVAGRITLVDEHGPFGNPSSDSARTMVTTATTNAMVVVFAPVELARAQVESVLSVTATRLADIAGGAETARLTCE